jgi:hypothetical protein
MPTEITITSVSGATPFNVYICDDPIITCVYVDTITVANIPYSFNVPSILDGQTSYNLKVVDNNGCTVEENLTLL